MLCIVDDAQWLDTPSMDALALIELPAALTARQLAGSEPMPELLLTRELERLFVERVRRLPKPSQRLLVLVAADETGRMAPVMHAAKALGIGPDALNAAEQAGLLRLGATTLEVRHPLVRSAVYNDCSWSQRRSSHLALAEALAGEGEWDQRAWHRAAAADAPDETIAGELEASAERARLRGGYTAATAALERAAALSSSDRDRTRRLVAAAEAAWFAGKGRASASAAGGCEAVRRAGDDGARHDAAGEDRGAQRRLRGRHRDAPVGGTAACEQRPREGDPPSGRGPRKPRCTQEMSMRS